MGEGDVGRTRATENDVVPTKMGCLKPLKPTRRLRWPSAKMKVFTRPFSPPCKTYRPCRSSAPRVPDRCHGSMRNPSPDQLQAMQQPRLRAAHLATDSLAL